MEAWFLVLEPHFCCQFVLCKLHSINFEFSTLRRCSGQVLDFGFRPNHRSNLRNQFAMRPPFFALHLLNKSSDCQLQLLPTTVRLAPTTHLEERSLPIGDELAESPLVSKSHNPNSPARSQSLALVRPHELHSSWSRWSSWSAWRPGAPPASPSDPVPRRADAHGQGAPARRVDLLQTI